VDSAASSVYISTYIFETNRTGRRFIQSLAAARRRGVDVRVLLDGIGELYSFPWAGRLLKQEGVPVCRFLPPRLIPPSLHLNLRNHRKIMIADGRVAFIGGMNIGDRHLAGMPENPGRVIDTHFSVAGPVVQQVAQVFLEDWAFGTGLPIEPPPPPPEPQGEALCRVVVDGPNEDLDKLGIILVAAVSLARERVWLMTPYFLPTREMIGALQTAALKGLDVRVILPGRNNLPFVHWATRNMLWELLSRNVRVFYQPPPFVHSKIFLMDDDYGHVGSANIDPRSLRLNFEITMEIYSRKTAAVLADHMAGCCTAATEFRLADLQSRSLPARLRDAAAWVFSPYL